ncbi:MAG: carbohydrate kinase family protein [Chloroflexi bacterium]|jgi:adenosine kinase|nr:carbohydrate kinase family protein [Chloroflexota bacterium]MDP6498971.1 carbohydrate kinase family protein [Dehalococcoidia bacterium]MQG11337.1 carbohydrate kinase family protein [SAR202 cluster bacterium]MQG55932.1 carbohydrate kinase family protein [SAR202 cluster bacterium]|tara:strand:- start:14210 stop:15139 length:930 start_codon:yes stop_codon:yes gene_type:complete
MDILVSGSMAYDRIMDFEGKFSDHILPDQIDNINVSFTVNSLTENFGGTAGNIAYSLSLLGEKPRILATIGQDYHRYFEWLKQIGVSTDDIRVVEEELTAGAYITSDTQSNQITGFNPGAMKQGSGFDFAFVDPKDCLAIVAPGNLGDMAGYTAEHEKLGIFSIFDPGQSLPAWEPAALAKCISQSKLLVCNDYEMEMICNNTGKSREQVAKTVETIVVTKGGDGCDLLTASGTVAIPVVRADDAVDPTGAGDAFRGGLIKGIVEGKPMERAVQMGNVAGHYAVRKWGTQQYSFTMAEFNAVLEQNFGP